MKRLSMDEVCAPGLSWWGKTRLASDIGFHMGWVLSCSTRRLRHEAFGCSVPSLCYQKSHGQHLGSVFDLIQERGQLTRVLIREPG